MSDDYGFYGSGTEGYTHYNQAVDDSKKGGGGGGFSGCLTIFIWGAIIYVVLSIIFSLAGYGN